jgi:hypothetical protein
MKTSTAAITTARGRPQNKSPINEKRIRRRNASQTAARGLVQCPLKAPTMNDFIDEHEREIEVRERVFGSPQNLSAFSEGSFKKLLKDKVTENTVGIRLNFL